MESISFCLKLNSIVLMPSVFPSSFFLHSSLLFSVHFWVFFPLHSISVTGTTSLFVSQNVADYNNTLILQAVIANASIFLCLFTESMGNFAIVISYVLGIAVCV